MKLNNNWKLYYVKDSFYHGGIKGIEKFEHFDNVTIPTLFELELFRNGVLGEPYFSTNIWDYQKYEDYHQFYVLNFRSNKKNKILKFHGIDTISEIYLNGKLIGITNNMYLVYKFALRNLKSENQLVVHILPSVLEGFKFKLDNKVYAPPYSYESLYIRKSPASFGWDILPRTPLGGIYLDVELLDKEPILEDVRITPSNISKESATLKFDIITSDKQKYDYVISGVCKNSKFELKNKKSVTIKKPKLWTIRGFGEQNLYRINVSLYKEGKLVSKKQILYGIRKVELLRTPLVQENGCFEFHINGEKVFLLGANWVPVDAIKHVDRERMNKALDAVLEAGCNAVRVWGGGTYELDEFYERCDKEGIFVWQDFMMGCAIYPQDEYFQGLLREETEQVVRRLRNHCSICLWAGDNEDDLAAAFWCKGKINPNENIITRKTIPEAIEREDGTRPYIPSSPYIDEEAEKHLDQPLSEDHLWGPRDYFKGNFYGNAKCYFTSETGYHAINSISSLNKYLKKPWPLFVDENIEKDSKTRLLLKNYKATKEHLCHCTSIKDTYDAPYEYRTRLMVNQVNTLFVNDINNLKDFVMASQISQAEALKYFIERMRKDYKRNGGVIWWDIIDGWPQPADSVIDYYFCKKLSYYYIQRSQKPTCLMMNEDSDGLNLYLVSSENKKHNISYEIFDGYTDEKITSGIVDSRPRDSFIVDKINVDRKTLLIIKYKDESGKEYINHFHTKIIDIDLYDYLKAMEKNGLIDEEIFN